MTAHRPMPPPPTVDPSRPSRGGSSFRAAALTLLAAVWGLGAGSVLARPAPIVAAPGPDAPLEGTLGAGGVHRWDLPPCTYLLVAVEQRGVDLALRLVGPSGVEVAAVDLNPGSGGLEHLAAITAEGGSHRLEIRADGGAPQGAGYRLWFEEIWPARPFDLAWVEAEGLYARALTTSRRRTAEAFAEAVDLYRRSLDVRRTIDDPEGQAKTLHNLGTCLRRIGRGDAAAERYREALPLWRRAGHLAGEIDSLNNLAFLRRSRGDVRGALELYRQGLELVGPLGDLRREAQLQNNLGRGHQELYELDLAQAYFESALALRVADGDRLGEATTRINLGNVHEDLGQYQEALGQLHRAASSLRELGDDRRLAAANNALGNIHSALGDYEAAILFFGEALQLNRRLGDRRREARTLNNLGRSRHFAGDSDGALDDFRAALELHRALADPRAEATTRVNIARSLAARPLGARSPSTRSSEGGPPSSAAEHLEAAETLYRALGDRLGEVRVLAERAAELVPRGDAPMPEDGLDAAAESAALALQRARALGDRRTEVFVHGLLATLDRRRGRLAAAAGHLETACGILEGLRAGSAGRDHRAGFLAANREYYERWIEVLVAQHRAQPEGGHAARAFGIAERARARGLLDTLADAGVDAAGDADPKLARRERLLGQRVEALDLRRLELSAVGDDARLGRIETELATAVADLRAVRSELRRTSRRWRELEAPSVADLATARSLLDSDTALMAYTLGERQSFVFWVTAEDLKVHRLPGRGPLAERVRGIREALVARGERPAGEGLAGRRQRIDAADRAVGRRALELGETLLGPLAGRLGSYRRVAIVAEGALHYLPFSVLTVPGTGRQPLVARHELVSLPSVSVLSAMRRRGAQAPPIAEGSLAVVADPVFESVDARLAEVAVSRSAPGGFRRLPESGREADRLAALVGGDALIARGFEATRELVTGGTLEPYRILHFATHGVVDSRHPELSALVLSLHDAEGGALDGFLRLHDLYRLRLGAALVVLSACQTALGRQVRGEGPVGLARGFMHAGVPRVVASLWTVEDRSTRELMERFYVRMLEEGEPPSAALRSAQLEMRADPRFAAPYHWASFMLQGEWR
ncbi:MAG: CHAT domain-containing tetratricopeptide repeat protein [Acidobacteriota bacterium]